MKIISHRGNLNGPESETENSPKKIEEALKLGYECEIDVWYQSGVFTLCHDFKNNKHYNVNVEFLKKQLIEIQDIVMLPEAEPNSEPSWFGFPITIKKDTKFKREDIIKKLTDAKIGTRLLFAGNLTKQPAYIKKKFIVSGNLNTTDLIMQNTFWVGIQPSLGEEELSFVGKTILDFFKS